MSVSPKFYQRARLLRKHLPCLFPVRVRTCEILRADGIECWGRLDLCGKGRKRYYLLRVVRAPLDFMTDALIHEWAHALVYHPENPAREMDVHDDAWGLAYAACYRLIVDKQRPGVSQGRPNDC